MLDMFCNQQVQLKIIVKLHIDAQNERDFQGVIITDKSTGSVEGLKFCTH